MKYQRWLNGPDIHGKGRFYLLWYEFRFWRDAGIYKFKKAIMLHVGFLSIMFDFGKK